MNGGHKLGIVSRFRRQSLSGVEKSTSQFSRQIRAPETDISEYNKGKKVQKKPLRTRFEGVENQGPRLDTGDPFKPESFTTDPGCEFTWVNSLSTPLAEKAEDGLRAHVCLCQGRRRGLLQNLQSDRFTLLFGKVGIHDSTRRRFVGTDRLSQSYFPHTE